MIKATIFTLFLFCIGFNLFSQSNPFNFIDSAHANYRNGNYDKSILYWDSLYQKAPSWYNNTFSVIIDNAQQGDKTAIRFIDQYCNSDVLSAQTIKPISMYLWVKNELNETAISQPKEQLTDKENIPIQEQKSSKSIAESLYDSINNSSDTNYYSTLYYTAIFLELQKKIDFPLPEQLAWLKLLEDQNKNTSSSHFNEVEALKIYMDFIFKTAYFYLGEYPVDSLLSVPFSPIQIDDLRFFSLLHDSSANFPSVLELKKTIITNEMDKKNPHYLSYAASIVVSYPTNENLQWLESIYNLDQNFDKFWLHESQLNWEKLPNDSTVTPYIDSLANNKWVILDIWGTWCGPCVRELPLLAEMDLKQREVPSQPIKFLTLSYSSKGLEVFMDTNSYTFPVIEIKNETCNNLGVNSYPTTFLISPARRFTIIPTFQNKEGIIKIFTLLDW